MNRENLEKLATYLESLPKDYDRFDMSVYMDVPGSEPGVWPSSMRIQDAPCGSVACAVGHGPAAGIPFSHEDAQCWALYGDRVFGLSEREWPWCFGYSWVNADNTPHGAAARIRYMLACGVPDNQEEQRLGRAPLCYR